MSTLILLTFGQHLLPSGHFTCEKCLFLGVFCQAKCPESGFFGQIIKAELGTTSDLFLLRLHVAFFAPVLPTLSP